VDRVPRTRGAGEADGPAPGPTDRVAALGAEVHAGRPEAADAAARAIAQDAVDPLHVAAQAHVRVDGVEEQAGPWGRGEHAATLGGAPSRGVRGIPDPREGAGAQRTRVPVAALQCSGLLERGSGASAAEIRLPCFQSGGQIAM
jgi:hypothetical protein